MRLTLPEAFAALGVDGDASPELVRKSYRQLALRFHPDKNPSADATATFQRVSAAYKRICDHREQQKKREASADVWPSGSPFFFDGSDDEFERDDDDDDDDDISLDDMLFMFQMMFGVASNEKHGARRPAPGKPAPCAPRAKSNQTASGRVAGVSVNIGGRRRRGKGKRKAKHDHGSRGLDEDLAGMEEEMARMFMADPFAFHVDELGSDKEDAEFMDLARLMAMGGLPEMRGLFGTRRPRGRSGGRGARASTPAHGSAFCEPKSENQRDEGGCPLEVGASVQVYSRHLGVVKFIGHVHYAKGEFVGVELRDEEGKNSGTVKGVRYFSCAPGHGLMVRPADVARAPRC